jgi:hypothetical protein
MSQQAIALLTLPMVATTAVAQYRGVGYNGAQATVAGQKILGISRRGAAINQDVDLTVKGTAVAESGGAFAAGVALTMDASGRVVAAGALTATVGSLQVGAGATAVTSTAASGAILTGAPSLTGGDLPQYIVGYSLQAASGAGEFPEILMN